MSERSFTRARILQALQALGEELTRQGIRGQIFVVGGAAMALAYSSRRSSGRCLQRPIEQPIAVASGSHPG